MASTLLAELIDRVQRTADRVDSSYRVRALNSLDEAVQWLASVVPWDALIRLEDFQASGEFLILPDRVNKVIRIGDRTNQRELNARAHIPRRNPGGYFARTTGTPVEWRELGFAPVARDLATNTQLYIHSTASEAINVQVRGLVQDSTASGTALEFYEAKETVVLAGVTETTTNTYKKIISIQKDHATSADVLVGAAYDGLQVARIPGWETRPMYRRLQLHPVPTGQAVEVEYFRRPNRLTSENDPIDPSMSLEALMWRAVGNMHWLDQEGQPAQLAWRKAEEYVAQLQRQDDTHGEEDSHTEPWGSYLGMEDTYWEG